MIGLVLVTHGRLAVEFRAALEHVVGPQEQIETVTIGPDDDVEQRRRDIIEAVKRADLGDGVVILTDMFGGTPSNLSISVMNRPNVEVLAGVNLPMLVKLAVRADCPLDVRRRPGSGQEIHHRREPRACREMTSSAEDNAQPGASDAIVRVLKIVNEKGLHARASAKFVQTVEKCDVRVTVSRGHERAGGDSIMGLMMLAAGIGAAITVSATGPEAKQCIDALDALVSGKFGEESREHNPNSRGPTGWPRPVKSRQFCACTKPFTLVLIARGLTSCVTIRNSAHRRISCTFCSALVCRLDRTSCARHRRLSISSQWLPSWCRRAKIYCRWRMKPVNGSWMVGVVHRGAAARASCLAPARQMLISVFSRPPRTRPRAGTAESCTNSFIGRAASARAEGEIRILVLGVAA